VWSPWWWVFTSVETRVPVRPVTVSIMCRVRRSVPHVSMTTVRSGPASAPQLLIHHVPSGWM
jgi:hypothetical protein